MKLYKLNQGSTFENLKHFIYLTNEYGVPSDEFVDDFIDQFGKIILNGNFTFSRYSFTELDDLWKEIEQDCKDNQTTCAYNYGSLFYYIIGSKAVSILKDTVGEQEWNSETEDNKLIYLKTFIEDFDKYITEEYKTEFEKIINDAEKDDNTVVVEKETVTPKKLTQNASSATTQVPPIKHYSLIDEYREGSENSLIGVPLYIEEIKIGIIASNTEIKTVDDKTIDLGDYIYKNNVEPNKIKAVFAWFNKIYKEI